MRDSRRAFLRRAALAGAGLSLGRPGRAASGDGLVDIAGRHVALPLPARRIILGDGPLAYVVALLQPGEPFAGVVGWGDNFRSADLGGYEAYRARFPRSTAFPRSAVPPSAPSMPSWRYRSNPTSSSSTSARAPRRFHRA